MSIRQWRDFLKNQRSTHRRPRFRRRQPTARMDDPERVFSSQKATGEKWGINDEVMMWCPNIYILVGGWPTPLENINEKDYPIYEMENKHVPILGNVPQIMPKMGIWAWKKNIFFHLYQLLNTATPHQNLLDKGQPTTYGEVWKRQRCPISY